MKRTSYTRFLARAAMTLLAVLFSLTGARAQNTLTVCDGTVTNQFIPFYAYSGDTPGTTSEFVIPASELTAMNGKAITAMSFYLSQSQSKAWTAVYQIYMTEISGTTLDGTTGPDDCTVVYTGTVDASGSQINIEFEDSYTYNGGNLLIGTYVLTSGSYDSYGSYYGVEVTGAAYLSGAWGSYSGSKDFIPKTTFTYETPSSCYKPKNLTATLTPGDGTIATLTWERNDNGTEDAWVLQYGIDETFAAGSYTEVQVNTTPSADLTGLTAETTYYARVKPECDTEGTKWSKVISFTPTDDLTLTVNDGSVTNTYVPFYGYYADSDANSQFIIPAADLADMQWGTINKLTFYTSTASAAWDGAKFNVYMSEVGNSAFESATFVDWTSMEKVYTGSVSVVDNKLVITLTAPYQYMGGNLLIGFDETSNSSNYPKAPWYGVTQTGNTAVYQYSNNDAVLAKFLPKTTFAYTPGEAPTCFKPTNLAVSNISTNSADLSWNGTSDSYVLQYRTAAHNNMNLWEQVGDDVIATATLTQYTFDLSSYNGTGNIAIRHYNVSDMYRLAVDDIVVTNAGGETVVSEDFENGIPSGWTNMDYDGDGNVWNVVSFSGEGYQNGSYCVNSESYINNFGPLNPDNWLIIPDVQLGGTLTLYARGVDESCPQENFGVFVTTESLETVFANTPAGEWSDEISTDNTYYELSGLTANTPYEWQVKGDCGVDGESSWASSSFTTLPEGFKTFITTGNWNVANNWFPAGVPTSEDEVSIEADVTIPAGVVATAKRATLNGGSILIKDGGQLKQGAATLRVTIEKEITGYGEAAGKYSFISSPFTGRTLYEESGTWSRVDNMLDGDYDFYAFDSSAELEWINYEANPTHISFQSANGNAGLMFGEGYLYANAEDKTLQFVGTACKSINYSETKEVTYDATSTDACNGWQIVGNFFSCNAYITYSKDATFYKLNTTGTGFDKYTGGVELAPGEGAFIQVAASGTITYSTEAPDGFTSTNAGTATLPYLPLHGLNADQDANTEGLFLNFAKEGFATYYNSQRDVVLPEGMLARIVTAKDSESLTYETIAEGGGVVPAATAVLLQVEASENPTKQPIYLAEKSAAAITSDNLLNGSDVAGMTEGTGIHYMLSYDKNNANIGWYWGAANGGAFTNGAHKAYLVVPASAKNRSFIGLPGYEETTGIISIENEKLENGTWYTLDGMKLDKQPTHKGLYIQDGKKVMVK